MTMSDAMFSTMIADFADKIAAATTYELDGVQKTGTFEVITNGSTVRVILQFETTVAGHIGSIKVYDAQGVLACSSDKSFVKRAGKRNYAAFAFEFSRKAM